MYWKYVSAAGLLILALYVSGGLAAGRETVEIPFDFDEGWNMVSGFYLPEQLSGGAVEPEHIRAIYALVPETQQYVRLYPNPEKDKLKVMGDYDDRLDYMAQWVYSTRGGTAEYMSEREEILLKEWQLHPGWNFVALSFLEMIGKTLEDFKGSCRFSKVYLYDGGASPWIDMLKRMPLDRFAEQGAGHGLAIKVPAACKLGIVNTTPPPPALPE